MSCGHNHDEILFRQLPHVPERIIALEAEVAEKDKRIAELEAGQQAAIDGALESVIREVGYKTMHNPGKEFFRGVDHVLKEIRSRIKGKGK